MVCWVGLVAAVERKATESKEAGVYSVGSVAAVEKKAEEVSWASCEALP